MPLESGDRLGPYDVLGSAGKGGMGEVYRARDARLHRDVAIKVLPDLFADDPERLARFTREAQTLAALSHPHIAQIYGLIDEPSDRGPHVHALAMEWVEGEDLARRLERGPLPVDEALGIARQIADALEAAHEQGIVHRDIKPANIKVRPDGSVKVLDFGLARGSGPAPSGSDPLVSPTMTSPALTAMGVILGTAAYMSPEQARGRVVDRRADIWAFGVVLVEMLTGRPLFAGDSVSDVLVSLLSAPIDLDPLPSNVPPRVRELIARCLERDPKRRLRDIGEARLTLEEATASTSPVSAVRALPAAPGGAASMRASVPLRVWLFVAFAVAVAAILGGLWGRSSQMPSASPRLQLEIGAPSGAELVVQSNAGAAVISPDGSMVAFLAQNETGRALYVRSLSSGEARPITGSQEAHYPFWSPDSRSLAFFGATKLFTVSIAGGLPEAIADIELGRGGTWTDDGSILFTPRGGGFIHRVSERGGAVEAITALDPDRGENAHYWPVALPGGRRFLFFVRSTRPENNGIYLATVDRSTPPVRLVTSLSSGLFVPSNGSSTGDLLWVRDGVLLSQQLDVAAARLTGDVITVASDVRVEESQRGIFASVSTTGALVWASAKASDFQMIKVGRDGRRLATLPIAPGKIMQPQISPDGGRLLFTRAGGGTADIWVLDLAGGTVSQMTSDQGYDENPVWSPDGRRVLNDGSLGDRSGVLLTAADASAAPRLLLTATGLRAAAFLPDGAAVLVAQTNAAGATVLSVVHVDRPDALEEVATFSGYARQLAVSPDGRWLAFVTDRRGRAEVVVAPLIREGPRLRLGERRVPISNGGGVDPSWRKDGRELLYLTPDRSVTAVSVTVAGDAFSIGPPVALFQVRSDAGGWGTSWTADPNHSSFVVVDAPHAAAQTFTLLMNWRR
jgi:Tol biopolymer transport system component